MRWGATGHRPSKLGGYDAAISLKLVDLAVEAIQFYGINEIDVGMALGWDQAVAEAATWCGIPFHAVVPFVGMEERWPETSQVIYRDILARAATVTIITSNATTANASFHVRNMEIVKRCHDGAMLALWDGSFGGTCNALRYARQCERPIVNLWSKFNAMR